MTRKLTNKEFLKKVYDVCGDEYVFNEKYVNTKTKLSVTHRTCTKSYMVSPNNFLRGKRCPYCSHRVSAKEFYKNFKDKHLFGKYLETPYYDIDTPIYVYCSIHNSRKLISPSAIRKGRFLCDYCRSEYNHEIQKESTGSFINKLNKCHEGKIKMIGKYHNTHTKTYFKCNDCGEVFFSEPNSLISTLSGCPRCSRSFSENEFQKILKDNGIIFEQQKKFKDCKSKRMLPFDFYIPSKNTLIELDGEQHYKPIEYFGGTTSFESQVERDRIKDLFCENNGIFLIRVVLESNRKKSVEKLYKLLNILESNIVHPKTKFRMKI